MENILGVLLALFRSVELLLFAALGEHWQMCFPQILLHPFHAAEQNSPICLVWSHCTELSWAEHGEHLHFALELFPEGPVGSSLANPVHLCAPGWLLSSGLGKVTLPCYSQWKSPRSAPYSRGASSARSALAPRVAFVGARSWRARSQRRSWFGCSLSAFVPSTCLSPFPSFLPLLCVLRGGFSSRAQPQGWLPL